jgi:hypothetical protein
MGAIALVTIAFVISKVIELLKYSTVEAVISLGEEILSQNTSPEKQAGVKAFAYVNPLKPVNPTAYISQSTVCTLCLKSSNSPLNRKP